MNELSTILTTLLSAIVPLLGGGVLLYRKQNKRLKEAEAALAEVNVSKAKADMAVLNYDYEQKRIEDLHEVNKTLNEQVKDLISQLIATQKEYTEMSNDKTARIREKDEVITKLTSKILQREQYISAQQRFIDWLKNWHCKREYGSGKDDCRRREPEQKVKSLYDPPPEMEVCDLPVIPTDGEVESKAKTDAESE